MNAVQEELRRRLGALGFDAVRFARVDGVDATGGAARDASAAALDAWIAEGFQADMQWMERSAEKRRAPGLVLSGAKSIVLLGVNYWSDALAWPAGRAEPIWARYALYSDYHDTMNAGLVSAGRAIEELCGVTAEDYRYYVDTGPVLERGWAAQAGLGFLGKNAMLISREFGNWLFLAAILTRLEFESDPPVRRQIGAPAEKKEIGLLCGKCTRCMDACPTQAIRSPGAVDARRCISYQTIENKGIIPRELRRGIGARIYGCDVCLEVCPWNRFAQEGRRVLLAARHDLAELSLREILELTPERFAEVFRKTAIKRVKLAGLLRNACIVAANTHAAECLDVLARLGAHASPVVRAHAVWAVGELAGAERARALLADARKGETDTVVLAEYAAVAAAADPPTPN